MAFDQNAKLTFVLQAKDLSSKTFKEARSNLGALDSAAGKTGKSFSGLSKLGISPMNVAFGAAALGATVLVGGLISATKAAIDEQKNIAKLTASLKANVPAWDGNSEAIEKVIATREKLAFSDDDLRDSLAKLVGVTHNVGDAFHIQSIAMDLARFKGISLVEASEALIKVEGGSFRALKALIGSTKDITTAEEAMAAVEKVAAGQREAFAATTEGKMLTAQIKLDDAMEDFGKVTLPIVTGAVEALTFVLDENRFEMEKIAGDTFTKNVPEGAKKTEIAFERVGKSFDQMVKDMSEDASSLIDDVYDPAIRHAQLAADKQEYADLRRVLSSSKSTKAEKQDARDRMLSLSKDADETRLALLTAGDLTVEETKEWLGKLKRRYASETGAAKEKVGDLIREVERLASLKALGINISVDLETRKRDNNPNKKFKAAGGPTSGLTWVGEKGPELLDLPPGSYVHSNADSNRMTSGSVVNMTFNSTFPISPADAKRVVPEIVREMRRQHVLA